MPLARVETCEPYAKFERLYSGTLAALERAKTAGNLRGVAALVRTGRECLMLLGIAMERRHSGETRHVAYSWPGVDRDELPRPS